MHDKTVSLGVEPVAEDNHLIRHQLKPATWLSQIDLIDHLVLDNNILIAVLGESGNGKTSFINLMHDTLDAQIVTYLFTANALFDRETFLAQLGIELKIAGEVTFASLINQTSVAKKHHLIIIDDAHFLPTVFIEEILAALYQQEKNDYFHICLISNFSLITTLHELDAKHEQEIIRTIELGALSKAETKAYIADRLDSTASIPTITDQQITQFYNATQGDIATINAEMSRFFLVKEPTFQINKLFLRTALLTAIAVVILGVGYWGLIASEDVAPAEVVVAQPLVQSVPTPPMQAEFVILKSEIPTYYLGALRQSVQSTPLRRADLVAINEQDTTNVEEPMVVMDKVVVIPKVVQTQPVEKTGVAHVTKPVPPKKLTPARLQHPPSFNANHYVIQLFASHNKHALKRFAQTYHIKNQTRIFTRKNQGEVWYILAFGDYKQYNSAKSAIKHLPKGLVQFKPWVRSLSINPKLALEN